jgi:hypothetical protein
MSMTANGLREVRLLSCPMFNTPGLLRWAMNGYKFPEDRGVLLRVFTEGFPSDPPVPANVFHRLLLGELPYTVDNDQAVCFTYGE